MEIVIKSCYDCPFRVRSTEWEYCNLIEGNRVLIIDDEKIPSLCPIWQAENEQVIIKVG